MSSTLLLAGIAPLLCGALLLFLLWKNLAGVRHVLRWRPSPLRSVKPGPASIAGVLKASSEPLASRAGRPCVLLRSRYRARSQQTTRSGSKTTITDTSRWMGPEETEAVSALLDDGAGHSMPVDLEGAGVVGGEVCVHSWPRDGFVKLHPELEARVPLEADDVELHETYLVDGSRALIHGTAREVEAREDELQEGAGYRQPPRRTLLMGTSEEAPLVLVPGGRFAVVSSAVLPGLGVILLSLAFFAMGALVLQAGLLWATLLSAH